MPFLRGFTLLLCLQLAGELLARGLGLPLPGPVLGLVLLLPALAWEPLRRLVEPAATLLLQHLSLLFVPVGVGVITHLAVIGAFGWKLALVIVLSSWAGLVVTALVLRLLARGPLEPGAAAAESAP